MNGTLYGVGVGPGDPDLITLKAARLIERASVIAYPTLAGSDSFARAIAADLISEGAHEIRMDVPMTTDRAPAQAAYDAGARDIRRCWSKAKTLYVCAKGIRFSTARSCTSTRVWRIVTQ